MHIYQSLLQCCVAMLRMCLRIGERIAQLALGKVRALWHKHGAFRQCNVHA